MMTAPAAAWAHGGGDGHSHGHGGHGHGGHDDPVGLSLFVRDGQPDPLRIISGPERYMQEMDIVASAVTADDEGIDPLIDSGDLSGLDWSGIDLVDEEWRPSADGTFIRQRFYRGAAWMEDPSWFVVFQADDDGILDKPPIRAFAGFDDFRTALDDGFVRRFDARQIATGCPAIGDCEGATQFVAQGLVQLRDALHADHDARKISKKATRLLVSWSADSSIREIPVEQVSDDDAEFGYGFEPRLDVVSAPANGQYFVPGESFTVRLSFFDGEGNQLNEPGSLPTYGDFLFGDATSGLHYIDLSLTAQLYYALKHREGGMTVALSGPTDRLRVSRTVTPGAEFFGQQATFATVAHDGYSAAGTTWPNFGIIVGGFGNPAVWDTPIADTITLTVPADALPGTYVIAMKARRDYAGEALNRGDVTRIQVGQTTKTAWTPTTGNCQGCHSGPTAFTQVLHGIDDREACFGCHSSLDFEPDNALDYRVHFIHARSERFPADPNDCSVCHLSTPEGPAIGYPGETWPF
jgi:hypothetical protein